MSAAGAIALTTEQLSTLLESCEWRALARQARAGGLIRTSRDRAGAIGGDATLCVIIIVLCRSISRLCLTIECPAANAAGGRD